MRFPLALSYSMTGLRDYDRTNSHSQYDIKTQRRGNKHEKIMSTLKPKLQAIMKKYESTTINPIQLIKKHQESVKRGHLQ